MPNAQNELPIQNTPTMISNPEAVEMHYSASGRLARAIRDAIVAAGKDVRRLEPEDLESIEEFHIRGRAATLELAQRMNIQPGTSVLDVGSGLGGPARTLARNLGCHVTGIDLTRDFCDAAREISRWVGLSNAVTFVHGNAAALNLHPASFDAAITIHAAMNVARKDVMYAGIHKALKPGGRFGIYDVVRGEGAPVLFPVPWARDETISHLATPDQMRHLLDAAGFSVEEAIDSTEASAAWFSERRERFRIEGPPRVGFHLFLGQAHAEMMANQVRNLMERRIRTVTYVAVARDRA